MKFYVDGSQEKKDKDNRFKFDLSILNSVTFVDSTIYNSPSLPFFYGSLSEMFIFIFFV